MLGFGRRLPQNRKFNYDPLYYDPKKEEKEGRRIKFERKVSKKEKKAQNLFYLFFLIVFILYIIYYLKRL